MSAASLLLCASPRRGNCLKALNLFAAGFNEQRGDLPEVRPTMLSDSNVLPCIDCGTCRQGRACPLLERDDSAALLEAFADAPFIAIAAPIYFYHLPAQLKALLDRCQQYYAWGESGVGGFESRARRKAFIMLCAARERGEQVFSGALLTMRFALAPFNLRLHKPLTMRGLDQPGDLSEQTERHLALKQLGADAAALLTQKKED